MMVVGLAILLLSGALYVDERYSMHVPFPGESYANGVFVQDDQHGMGCHFNWSTPRIECMTDEQWDFRDLERELKERQRVAEELKQLLQERNDAAEDLMWELLEKHGLIWKA